MPNSRATMFAMFGVNGFDYYVRGGGKRTVLRDCVTEPIRMSLATARVASTPRSTRPPDLARQRCRRSIGRVLLCTLVSVLAAIPAHAAPIQVSVEAWFAGWLTETGMEVGGFGFYADAWTVTTLKTGPVLSITFDEFVTTYSLGPGELVVDASWYGAPGVEEHGTFAAPIAGFDFAVIEDAPFQPTGSATATFGPGLFDTKLAQHLGVERRTVGGLMIMNVDVMNFLEPGPVYREIGTNLTMFHINAETCSPFPGRGRTGGCFPGSGEFPVEVPEPSLLLLGAVSAAGIALRRRR
jgi:hypothetical protein